MKASNKKYRPLAALLIAALAAGWSCVGHALTLECRSESVTPGRDAAKAKQPHSPVGHKSDFVIGAPAPDYEWRTTDKRYFKDYVVGSARNTVFWVDRETGEYWILEFTATTRGSPKVLTSMERYYEYTGKCSVKNIEQKF